MICEFATRLRSSISDEKSEAAVAEYLKRQGFRIKTKSAQLSSDSGFDSGYQVGDQISLNKQVQSASEIKRLPNALI